MYFIEVAKNAWGDVFDYDSGADLAVEPEDRTSFSGLLVVLSLVVGDGGDDRAGIARSLTIAAAVGILGFAVLAIA